MRHIIGQFIRMTLEHFLEYETKRWTVKYLQTDRLPSNVKAWTVGEVINKKRRGRKRKTCHSSLVYYIGYTVEMAIVRHGIYPVYTLSSLTSLLFFQTDRHRGWCKEVYLYLMEAQTVSHSSVHWPQQHQYILSKQTDKRTNKISFEDACLRSWWIRLNNTKVNPKHTCMGTKVSFSNPI